MSVEGHDRETLDPVWNDTVESVVLARVFRQRDALRRRKRWLRRISGFAAVMGVAGGLLLGRGASLRLTSGPPSTGVKHAGATLQFAGGSRAEVAPDASVMSLVRTEREVRLSQERGHVDYVVNADPRRQFSVLTPCARLATSGASLSVDVQIPTVTHAGATRVFVASGVVEVSGPRGRAELGSGDSLSFTSTPSGCEPGTDAPAPNGNRDAMPRAKGRAQYPQNDQERGQ